MHSSVKRQSIESNKSKKPKPKESVKSKRHRISSKTKSQSNEPRESVHHDSVHLLNPPQPTYHHHHINSNAIESNPIDMQSNAETMIVREQPSNYNTFSLTSFGGRENGSFAGMSRHKH